MLLLPPCPPPMHTSRTGHKLLPPSWNVACGQQVACGGNPIISIAVHGIEAHAACHGHVAHCEGVVRARLGGTAFAEQRTKSKGCHTCFFRLCKRPAAPSLALSSSSSMAPRVAAHLPSWALTWRSYRYVPPRLLPKSYILAKLRHQACQRNVSLRCCDSSTQGFGAGACDLREVA